jgi:alkyl hydroperoxide reductase subunit AhpF
MKTKETFLNDDIQQQLRDAFADLDAPVKLVVFTQGEGGALECAMCADTRQLAEEVAALSPLLSVEVRDFVQDAEVAEQYGIDKIPAMAIVRGGDEPQDYGIRLYGIPSGYEFATLVEDIRMVSAGNPASARRRWRSWANSPRRCRSRSS